jgi:L-threonylcarbamoyladenylate synthase
MTRPIEIERAVRVLSSGGLVAFPTETVYGLGADATNEPAVCRVFAVKGRPTDDPLIVHLADRAALGDWACDIPSDAWRLADRFWPGPLTLILRRSARVPDIVTGGLDTVGLRVPAHPMARALLNGFGSGVAAPSANRFGGVSPTTAAHVVEDLGASVDLVLDGGPCTVGVESTIVDVSSGSPAILRPGGVTREELERALGKPLAGCHGPTAPCPGQLPSHYAPAAQVFLLEADQVLSKVADLRAQGLRFCVLHSSPVEGLRSEIPRLRLPQDPARMARGLYEALRELDRRGFECIVAVRPPEAGLGLAVVDRLSRAAGPRHPQDATEITAR